jgi:hypothetical protein
MVRFRVTTPSGRRFGVVVPKTGFIPGLPQTPEPVYAAPRKRSTGTALAMLLGGAGWTR